MKLFNNVYKNQKVMVIGHTGFKGSWLTLWLIKLGAKLGGFSINVPTTPSNFNLFRIKKYIQNYKGDIRNFNDLCTSIDKFRPKVIFHLAAQSLVKESFNDPLKTFKTNTLGIIHLMECVRRRPWIKAVVLITSDKAYRNDERKRGYKETDFLGGSDPYSGSKSSAEIIINSYYESFFKNKKTLISIARAGNVIGGGDWANDRIIPDCIRALKKGKKVSIRSPKSTRPWQHVLESLSGYLTLGSFLLRKKKSIHGEAFNFGPNSKENKNVLQILNSMKKKLPKLEWQIKKGREKRMKESKILKLSCKKAKKKINWKPVLNFSETINFTTSWYKNWLYYKADIQKYSFDQINKYCELALSRKVSWIKKK